MVKKYIYKIGYRVLQIYWFIFRPHRSGAKVILTSGREVLLVMHTYGSGKWSLPGGGIEDGENPEVTVKRELTEELGVALPNPKFLGSFISRVDYKHDKVFVFTQKIPRDQQFQLQKAEIEEVRWFDINNLPELSPTTKPAIELFQNPKL